MKVKLHSTTSPSHINYIGLVGEIVSEDDGERFVQDSESQYPMNFKLPVSKMSWDKEGFMVYESFRTMLKFKKMES